MHVIGLTGKAGAGKSTFAGLLGDNYYSLTQKSVVIVPFANALKELALKLGWNGIKDEKGRRLLQLLGTDVCRECIDTDYWVKRWEEHVCAHRADGFGLIVADDVRFDNEISAIGKLDGKIYQLVGRAYELSTEAANHPSESQLIIPSDRHIDNSKSIPALNLQALKIIRELTGIND